MVESSACIRVASMTQPGIKARCATFGSGPDVAILGLLAAWGRVWLVLGWDARGGDLRVVRPGDSLREGRGQGIRYALCDVGYSDFWCNDVTLPLWLDRCCGERSMRHWHRSISR